MFVSAWVVSRWHSARARWRSRRGDERGQATAEYALVLLGAAAIAVLLIAWATSGSGAGKIGDLLDKVLDAITSKVA
jgi:Flp pilus assembly pilin Flp